MSGRDQNATIFSETDFALPLHYGVSDLYLERSEPAVLLLTGITWRKNNTSAIHIFYNL